LNPTALLRDRLNATEDAEPRTKPMPPRLQPAAKRPTRVLMLFEKEWAGSGFAPLVRCGEVEVFTEGFDLFSFPSNARLLTFDPWRFIERLCDRYRGRVDAVMSNDEQFGCLLAAVVAQRLGLPGNDPVAIARAQHKLLLRNLLAERLPGTQVRAAGLPLDIDDPRIGRAGGADVMAEAVRSAGFEFPLFVKPIKATFSVLARKVDSAQEMTRHLTFEAFERLIIRRLVAPYHAVASRFIDQPCHPTRMILEEPVEAAQINVDGYAFKGDIRILGIVDECMYPGHAAGAKHFLRFAYPTALGPALRDQAEHLVREVMRTIGFRNGFFNCELFVLPDGRLQVVEINPRLAEQFVGIYRDVEGLDIFRMMVAIARGQDPAEVPMLHPRAGTAASFVFRRFDGAPAPAPAHGAMAWLREHFPHAQLTTYHKRGVGLRREYKWLGSHRYALLNLSAADEPTLHADFTRICARLGWTQGG
jgi:hypothetical protein